MAVCGRTSLRMSILNKLQEDLKVIFLTDTKCKIRFIYVNACRNNYPQNNT